MLKNITLGLKEKGAATVLISIGGDKVGRRTYEALNMRETTNLANLFQRLNRLPSDYAGLAIWCDFNQLKTALEELASNPRPGDSILTALLTGLCRASGQPYQK